MNTPLRYKAPEAECAVMTVYDGREVGPTSALDARVEFVDGVFGRFVCTDCQGYGRSNCEKPRGGADRQCDRCKGAGFLLVGL